MRTYCAVAREFGLTVSVPKTKFLVAGYRVVEEELLPIAVDGGSRRCRDLVMKDLNAV